MKIEIKESKDKEKRLFDMEYGDVFYISGGTRPAILINPKEIGVNHCKPNTKGMKKVVFNTNKWLEERLARAICFVENGNVEVLDSDTEVVPMPNSRLLIHE